MVTRLEVTNLLLEIDKIDPDAFVVQHPVKDTKGGMIKRDLSTDLYSLSFFHFVLKHNLPMHILSFY